MKTLKPIILGSQSPRRKLLLEQLGIVFTTKTADIDEVFPAHLNKEEIVHFLSAEKAKAIPVKAEEVLITSDTIVWINNEQVGKPTDESDARKMIQSLSGNAHEVLSGVCIQHQGKQHLMHVSTRVFFRKLSDAEIDYYIEKFKPFDKAGSYGIQEWIGMIGIDKIEGDYFNVMGLPVNKVYDKLVELDAIALEYH